MNGLLAQAKKWFEELGVDGRYRPVILRVLRQPRGASSRRETAQALCRYAENGELTIDNNLSERALTAETCCLRPEIGANLNIRPA